MPRTAAHLPKFPKGVSGNPKGRPKGSVNLTSELKRLLMTTVKDNGTRKTFRELLMQKAIEHAAKGNAAFFQVIMDRVDGPMKQQLELGTIPHAVIEWEVPKRDNIEVAGEVPAHANGNGNHPKL